MMKFSLLASGSKGNCCVVENADSRLVIDCGTTKKYLTNSFNEIGVDPHHVDGLLITHTHKDHVAALKLFEGIDTYAEEDLGITHQKRIRPDDDFMISSIHVRCIRLSHDAACMGYLLEDEESRLVYVTDTGYLKEEYYPLLCNANHYIFESNHDIGMLMKTSRPAYIKQRIIQDCGHLCNEDSAKHLSHLIGERTEDIVLAHLSEEGNSHEKALSVLEDTLLRERRMNERLKLRAAKQHEVLSGGRR